MILWLLQACLASLTEEKKVFKYICPALNVNIQEEIFHVFHKFHCHWDQLNVVLGNANITL